MAVKILDWTQKQEVSYCIPLWLRDEQVRAAVARKLPRVQPCGDKRADPIAVVCYGPSLADTWEEIRKFKYVITCSGSHKFLLEHGIVPTWHVEVDPRDHKIDLLGEPHPDVTYLPASTCSPKYFDHLESHGAKVQLWHVFSNEADALRLLPPMEWALTGGASVGLRCMTIARFFGFTEQHVFGMDGCKSKDRSHAAAHPNAPPGHSITIYEGVEYQTTPSMLECAKQTWHELDQMPDVKVQFYGEGLVQEMWKKYVPHPAPLERVMIGYSKPELISAEYRDLNAKMHSQALSYGVGGGRHAPVVLKLVEAVKPVSVLDYGCGKGYLAKSLPFPIWEYDPAIPEKSEPPRPADLVVCTDVLEHVEPEKLLFVLDDIRRCVLKVAYFTIHTGPAQKKLPDGRNTHLIQQNERWWRRKLEGFFTVGKVIRAGPELRIVVGPKPKRSLSVAAEEVRAAAAP